MREALLLERQEREHEAAFQELKAKLVREAAQAGRRDSVEGETVFAKIEELRYR